MAESLTPPRVWAEGGLNGGEYVGFPNGVDSFSHPLVVKPTQVRWLENAVTQGAFVQTRPGFKTQFVFDITTQDSPFRNWWLAAGRPIIHPQMLERFTPTLGPTQLVFAISGMVWYAVLNYDGSIQTPQQIVGLQFDPNANQLTGTRCTQTATIIAGQYANNIIPRNLLVIQDGINRAGIWDGLLGDTMNPIKKITSDEQGNTFYTDGYNETRIGLWCTWSGNRLWVHQGRLGFASDLGDPTHFTEELRLDSAPVFVYDEDVTGSIDRGTSGTSRSQMVVCTRNTTNTIWTGILSRFPTSTGAGWAFTPDFKSKIFSGVGCVAGKSMILHRGLLYWKSVDGMVLFDSTGTVNSTQNLPVIDQEMAYSKRRVAPAPTPQGDLTCGGLRGSYVFWSVPVGPVLTGRCYNYHTQVLDRQTTVVRSVGDSGPFSYGTTGWQGIWTGIRPVAWTNAPSGSDDRCYALSMDLDGVVRLYEAFQGNRADNGCGIPWLMETRLHRVAPSVFNYSNFRHFRVLLDQIRGNLRMSGAWRGMRSKYHEILDIPITATPGSIFTPLPEFSPIVNTTAHENFVVQGRDVVSQDVRGPGDDCQAVGVESQFGDDKDHAFSLLFRFTGCGAVVNYRIAADQVADNTEGQAVQNSGVSENGFNIVSPARCPEHIEGETPDYSIGESPLLDSFAPTLPVTDESSLYQVCIPPRLYFNAQVSVTLTCPEGSVTGPVTATVVAGTYTSEVSQAAADALAHAAAQAQAEAARAQTPCVFTNTEQQCTNTCPDGMTGEPITVTVEAGEITSLISVADANAIALQQACDEAQTLRDESPCTEPSVPNVLWGWGRNFRGSLGVGNTSVQTAPVIIGYSALDWAFTAHGSGFGAAVKTDGSLYSWGENFYGQLGLGTQSVFPSTANNRLYPTRVGTGENWRSVACGISSAAGIKTDGTLWTWGNNSSGELGLGDYDLRLVPTQVGIGTNWESVKVATTNILALKSDGTIWGAGLAGSQPDTSAEFVQIGTDIDWASIEVQHSSDGSNDISCGIKLDGTLWTWGVDLLGAGANIYPPEQIGTDSDWSAIAIGGAFFVAVKTTGTVWSAGRNDVGQLGQGNLTPLFVLTQIGSGTDWLKPSCGEFFGAAMKTDGSLWGWGQNTLGQLGQGGLSGAVTSPVQMGSDDKWGDLIAGTDDVTALRLDLTDPAPPPNNNGVASGGIYSISGGRSIHRFDANGTFVVYADTAMDYLVVGGGGAGGAIGGGGAGQVQKLTGIVVPAGTYNIAVAQKAFFPGDLSRGEAGGTASFNSTASIGGGGGGGISDGGQSVGGNGASGGGGGLLESSPFTGQAGGTGSTGHNGGAAATEVAGGGGGGNGAIGADGSLSGSGTGGAGGAGTSDSISGTAVIYAAGGGAGGVGAGGAGGSSVGGYGATYGSTSPSVGPITPGSGGGGAAGNPLPSGQTGTDGAYGVVIISYPTPP